MSFRLGSGISVPASITPVNLESLKYKNHGSPLLPTPGNQSKPTSTLMKITVHSPLAMMVVLASLVIYMMPAFAGNDRNNFNYRIPPSWSPENDRQYSFRAYMTDISLWIMLTDLQPHQQCAAIIMRLGGSAREMAIMITPQEMMQGGILNGVAVDAVTYLLGSLHARFSALEEESRLTAMTEMLAFARRHGEGINELLARYDVVRQRAALEGQFVMSTEGCALQLLRACASKRSIYSTSFSLSVASSRRQTLSSNS